MEKSIEKQPVNDQKSDTWWQILLTEFFFQGLFALGGLVFFGFVAFGLGVALCMLSLILFGYGVWRHILN